MSITLLLAFASCRPTLFTPKPMGYFRMDTPATHQYRLFDRPGYPYSFEYPVYASIEKDSVFFSEKADNPYWLNVSIPSLGAMINLTYKRIESADAFTKMNEDSHGLSFFHQKKADYLNEDQFYIKEKGISITLYTVGGNAASRYQFTATDSVRHFMRGALYFDVTPNADSLKPATDFLEQDIKHLLETLTFR